jgi:hypothetical protein
MTRHRILIAADVEDAALTLLERNWNRADISVVTTIEIAQAVALSHAGSDVYATTRSLYSPAYDEIRTLVAPGRPVGVLETTVPSVTYTRAGISDEYFADIAEINRAAAEPPKNMPLTALGGIAFPAAASDNHLPAALAADAALRRLQTAADLFKAAERAMREGAEQLALIADATPQRAFASSLYTPLMRAEVELSTVLESMRNVTPEVP